MSQFSLRLPDSLMDQAKLIAEEDNVSLNQFFLAAISEKLGELKTRKYFKARGENADIEKALLILESLQSNEPPRNGDQIL
ncbi:MAG: toxin-antitoxin system HicB family antitoxin [Pseudomonadota bacterium]